MTEAELDAIEAAAVAVVQDHARSTEERRAASREIRLCTAVRRLGGHVAVVQHERDVLRAERDRLQARIVELEAQTVRLAMCSNCLQLYAEADGLCGFCGAVQ